LINKLFSIERYDLENFSLLKEKIKINDLIINNIEIFKKKHNEINFEINIDEKI
jgi:hypothetical protein